MLFLVSIGQNDPESANVHGNSASQVPFVKENTPTVTHGSSIFGSSMHVGPHARAALKLHKGDALQ
jgi:hypothetical protein